MIGKVSVNCCLASPVKSATWVKSSRETAVGKQLELGLEVVPRAKVAGILINVAAATAAFLRRGGQIAAQAVPARLVPVEARVPTDTDAAFKVLTREHVGIVVVPTDHPLFFSERRRIAELAIAAGLPIVCGFREHVEDGALMSYGIDLREDVRHAAAYVGKILKGAKPTDLTIEQPTKFELVEGAEVGGLLSYGPSLPDLWRRRPSRHFRQALPMTNEMIAA